MTEWSDIVVYTLGGALLMMMAVGIALSALLPALDRWSKRYFITLFSLLLLYVIAMFADAIIYKDPKMAAVENVIYITEYLFFSVLTLMPILLLLHRCSESIKNSVLFRSVKLAPNAVIRNSIVMEDCVIETGAEIEYVITDKEVTITKGKRLCGASNFPVMIGKHITI